jgi:hypothetical protein
MARMQQGLQRGAGRLERVASVRSGYRGERCYIYDGGCAAYDFDLNGTTGSPPVYAVSQGLGFVSRDELRWMVYDYGDGRFELGSKLRRARDDA